MRLGTTKHCYRLARIVAAFAHEPFDLGGVETRAQSER
jgi:hypothetical protein